MLFNEPLHELLKKYRVAYISVIIFLMILTWDVWEYTKEVLPSINQAQVVPLSTAFASLIAGLFAVANKASTRIEHDDKH